MVLPLQSLLQPFHFDECKFHIVGQNGMAKEVRKKIEEEYAAKGLKAPQYNAPLPQ